MRDLILDTLRISIHRYPEVIPHLRGDAALFAQVYAYKVGEAPDDDVRARDEDAMTGKVASFLERQQRRITKAVRQDYHSLNYQAFWDNEVRLLWSEVGQDIIGILMHGIVGGLRILADEARGPKKSTTQPYKDIRDSVIAYALAHRDTWLQFICETTRDFVQSSIVSWIQSGDHIDELVKVLANPELGVFSLARANRIATTEVTRLYALANQAAWVESGVVSRFRWMTAMDERRCETCRENHGREFQLIDLDGLIPAHPNCRCWAQPIVNRDMANDRLDQILGEFGL